MFFFQLAMLVYQMVYVLNPPLKKITVECSHSRDVGVPQTDSQNPLNKIAGPGRWYLPFGAKGIFSGANLLLVSRNVIVLVRSWLGRYPSMHPCGHPTTDILGHSSGDASFCKINYIGGWFLRRVKLNWSNCPSVFVLQHGNGKVIKMLTSNASTQWWHTMLIPWVILDNTYFMGI